MFLCIAAGLTLYFTAEAIVKAISWQKKFIRKMNEQQLSPPSLSGYLHCKKELAVFPFPAGMSLIKLFLGGNNLIFTVQGEFV
jgi:hypothetical protein